MATDSIYGGPCERESLGEALRNLSDLLNSADLVCVEAFDDLSTSEVYELLGRMTGLRKYLKKHARAAGIAEDDEYIVVDPR